MRKIKKNSWHELKDNKCPKCKSQLMVDLFGERFEGCSCGFLIEEDTKTLLVERDSHVESKLQDK